MLQIIDVNEIFRSNLLAAMKEQNLSEAVLSRLAGLNARAVTDIRERRVLSPKISTVTALANALEMDPAEMLGFGKRYDLCNDLAAFLSKYSLGEQERILSGLSALGAKPTEE